MTKNKKEIKILFLQARDDEMKEHEFLCFDRLIDVPQENFVRVDLFRDSFSEALLDGIDAVILAGTGHYFSSGGHTETLPALIELVRKIHQRALPMLAVGYGHEVLTTAFGGTVVEDPGYREIGTVEMSRLPEAMNDPIFKHLPERFLVQISHNHSVIVVPPRTTRLVTNHQDNCCEVFVFQDRPIYAVQFHPELELKDVAVRLTYYKRKYFSQGTELDRVLAESRHTPEANRILNLFIDQVVCQSGTDPLKRV